MVTQYPDNSFNFLPTKGLTDEYIDCFVMRDSVRDAIHISLQNLAANRHHGLRFDGERGIGKSTIFEYLEKKYSDEYMIVSVNFNVVNLKTTIDIINFVSREIRNVATQKYGLYKIKKIFWAIADQVDEIGTAWLSVKRTGGQDISLVLGRKRGELLNYISNLREVGIKGILIMLDDADGIPLEVLGEVGNIFNESLEGVVSYIATGSDVMPEAEIIDQGGVPIIIDAASGILAYWERINLLPFTKGELNSMIDNFLSKFPDYQMLGNDRELIIALSGGNGRLLAQLLFFAGRMGVEIKNDVALIHITREVVEAVLVAAERLAVKLRATRANLEARNPRALRGKWW